MRVLIVDDDKVTVEVIRDSMDWKKLGISDVYTAFDVEGAKKFLLEYPIDIIISDIEMPKKSGLDLLKWYRGEEMQGKFLLLTSHENFQYATEALRFHAEEYLMKPFNVKVMEMVLQKILKDIRCEEEKKRSLAGVEWRIQNIRKTYLAFWSNLFSGRLIHTQEGISRAIEKNGLSLEMERNWRLVLSRITNMESDIGTYGRDLTLFMLENLHSDILCGSPENDHVTYFEHQEYVTFITVCEETDEERIKEKCSDLIKKCGNMLESTVTCCISEICRIVDFYDCYHRVSEILLRNIVYYGDVFFENQTLDGNGGRQPVLKLEQMDRYLGEKNKKAFLDYLKKELNARIELRVLDGEMLRGITQEVQQAVYAHLAKQGIQVSLLLSDETSVKIGEKADQSVIDMIRWMNYLLEKVFAYEDEIQKTQTTIDKINAYIQEHYRENIGRNEIGAHFYLAPEYLAKMYKRKTGKNLKDYINEYRLEQARILLNKPEMQVSEVAREVGFDNFSYFSTLFKKYIGMTPNEYRKQRIQDL